MPKKCMQKYTKAKRTKTNAEGGSSKDTSRLDDICYFSGAQEQCMSFALAHALSQS